MTEKIIVIDDEKDIRFFVKEVLEAEGYEVIEAPSGEKALEKLKENQVDLALIDFFMPGMTGRDLAEEIRKDSELKDLKFAFITVAQFREEGESDLEELETLDLIRKPFGKDELIQKVEEMLG